jgi:hypothetical protein
VLEISGLDIPGLVFSSVEEALAGGWFLPTDTFWGK